MALVARSERQRQELGAYWTQCERPLRLADTGWRLFRMVREHPILITTLAAVVGKVMTSVIGNRLGFIQKLGKWPGRLMTAWQIFTRFRAAFSRPQPR